MSNDVPLEAVLRAPAAVTHKEQPIEQQARLVDAPRKQQPVDPRQATMFQEGDR